VSRGNVLDVLSDCIYQTDAIPQDTYIFAFLHSHSTKFNMLTLTVRVAVKGHDLQRILSQ
jgi:hypothetical protein